MTSDPPSPAERAFLELQRRPREYARWAERVRLAWELARKQKQEQGGGP